MLTSVCWILETTDWKRDPLEPCNIAVGRSQSHGLGVAARETSEGVRKPRDVPEELEGTKPRVVSAGLSG